jgi:arsenate reductase (glutaredoxin)
VEIWHNPRCTKSRQTLALIEERGIEPQVRRYLDDPPTADALERALDALEAEPWDITRMGEDRARELGLASMDRDRDAWVALLVENPVLIERPIVLADDGRAAIGRPPENVLGLFDR